MSEGQWRNRIVGHDDVDPQTLIANPLNWRLHPDAQAAGLTESIEGIGFIRSVTVNQRNGRVVDGHLRVTLALKSQQDKIAVEYVDLDEREEAAALATLDPLAAMAQTSQEKLAEVAKQAQLAEGGALDAMLQDIIGGERKAASEAEDEAAGQLAICPELLERHDYLVFYFDNQLDWQVACEALKVVPMLTARIGKKTLAQKGLGRVLAGKQLLKLINGNGRGDGSGPAV